MRKPTLSFPVLFLQHYNNRREKKAFELDHQHQKPAERTHYDFDKPFSNTDVYNMV